MYAAGVLLHGHDFYKLRGNHGLPVPVQHGDAPVPAGGYDHGYGTGGRWTHRNTIGAIERGAQYGDDRWQRPGFPGIQISSISTYSTSFIIAAVVVAVAAVLLLAMRKQTDVPIRSGLKLRKEYGLFYLLAVLFGSRKQLFITFAPWVIVTIFDKPTQTIATLITIGGVVGILFQPFLGRAIDKFGERKILMTEALIFVVVCLGYGLSGSLFSENTAFLIVCGCYLIDQVLISVGMARSTYIKKIALQAVRHPAGTIRFTDD